MQRKIMIFIVCISIASLFMIFEGPSNMLKSHRWCLTDYGYSSDNHVCRNQCFKLGGMNCGINWQNCCGKNKCESKWYGDSCDPKDFVATPNCTSAPIPQ
ncbi:hypothetical protein pb186bvf_002787 [Paramecium bursaria]